MTESLDRHGRDRFSTGSLVGVKPQSGFQPRTVKKRDFRIDRSTMAQSRRRTKQKACRISTRPLRSLESFVFLFSFGESQHEGVLTIINNISLANLTAVTIAGLRFWIVLDSL